MAASCARAVLAILTYLYVCSGPAARNLPSLATVFEDVVKKLKKTLLLALLFFAHVSTAAALDISEIMQTLSQRSSSRANFVEL